MLASELVVLCFVSLGLGWLQQIGEIEELQDYVQSVDLIDVIDDPSQSTSKQAQAQPRLADGQQCKQCYDNCVDGRVDPTDGAHATSTEEQVLCQTE